MKKISFKFLITLSVLFFLSCNKSSADKHEVIDGIKGRVSTTSTLSDSALKSIHFCVQLIPENVIDTTKHASGQILLLWPEITKSLNITFLDGDPQIQEKVKQIAKEWESYCGITFNFGSFANPDISISFLQNGSWSYIGKSSVGQSPSMNYGWLTRATSDEEYSRVVLHEFGHALGLIHEHQNPNNNPIHWNKSLVYQYFMRPPNNWNKMDIDRNLFAQYNREQINGTDFDPKSIMLYSFPKELTLDGYSTNSNAQLSVLDKSLIADLYPKR